MAEEKKNEKKKQVNPKPTKTKAEPVKQVEEIEELEAEETQTISLFLAVGLIIGALVVGLVIGYLAAPKSSPSNDFVVPGSTSAPALTPEQLKGGKLPAGHPQVPGLAGSEASTQTTAAPETQAQQEEKESKTKK